MTYSFSVLGMNKDQYTRPLFSVQLLGSSTNIYVGGLYGESTNVDGFVLGATDQKQAKIVILQYAPNGTIRAAVRSGDVFYGFATCRRLVVNKDGNVIGVGAVYMDAILSGRTLMTDRNTDVLLYEVSFNR